MFLHFSGSIQATIWRVARKKVVYRDKNKRDELGRIIERPNNSLIEDINQLLL